jgi:hypothetical protein
MNIYGENCHRCGQKTRRIQNEEPTCGHCIAIIESRHEEIRQCPVDSTNMKKEIIQNIILDRCPKCSGIWFDKGEFESFEQLIKQVSNELMIHEIIKGIAKGKYEEN